MKTQAAQANALVLATRNQTLQEEELQEEMISSLQSLERNIYLSEVFDFEIKLFSKQDTVAQQLDDEVVEEVDILMPKVNPDGGKKRAELMKQRASDETLESIRAWAEPEEKCYKFAGLLVNVEENALGWEVE